jgi:tryptophanyl-tRNA synthetase
MSLRDAKNKMSKSDTNPLSRIELTDSPDVIKSKIQKSVTDSDNHISYDSEGRPGISNLIDIYCAFSGETIENVCSKYQNIERFKSVFKEDLTSLLVEKLSPIRLEIQKLDDEELYVEEILKNGSKKAIELANSTLTDVKTLVGFG